ncbi:hypothetical protein JXA47_02220 [Candidatus Sumerlaeota bacterium]|nr:hypothetical protein [Candidatus Sumerlaeota bacterium]
MTIAPPFATAGTADVLCVAFGEPVTLDDLGVDASEMDALREEVEAAGSLFLDGNRHGLFLFNTLRDRAIDDLRDRLGIQVTEEEARAHYEEMVTQGGVRSDVVLHQRSQSILRATERLRQDPASEEVIYLEVLEPIGIERDDWDEIQALCSDEGHFMQLAAAAAHTPEDMWENSREGIVRTIEVDRVRDDLLPGPEILSHYVDSVFEAANVGAAELPEGFVLRMDTSIRYGLFTNRIILEIVENIDPQGRDLEWLDAALLDELRTFKDFSDLVASQADLIMP